MEKTSIRSFVDKGHDYHLYTYDNLEGVPDDVSLKRADKIMKWGGRSNPEKSRDYATFSNIFRYKLLLEGGGIWVDTDIICMRPFNFERNFVFASERVERQSRWTLRLPQRPVGCVIKAPKGSRVISYCYERSKSKSIDEVEWAEIGTDLIGKAINKYNMEDYVKPFWAFCPVSWWNWSDFIDTSKSTMIKEKIKEKVLCPYSYHLWNSRWGDGGVSKDRVYPKNTIYGEVQGRLFSYK